MKKTIETVWNWYQEAHPFEENETRREIIEKITDIEKELRKELNKEQISLLNKMMEHQWDINYITEKEAFVKGVQFATQYLIHALH